MALDRRCVPGVHRSARRATGVLAGSLVAGLVLAACGGGSGTSASADLAVRQARAAVRAAQPPLSDYRGPVSGPPAQPPALVVFVAADTTDGDIAAVARGVKQAAAAIGWPLQILNGQATTGGQSQALSLALHEKPGGIILGGVDAAVQRSALRQAQAQGVPVVGWHASPTPGPDPESGLFTNVTADPATVARLAADYAIADSGGRAGVVIFTDPEYTIDTYTSEAMASDIGRCRHCSVLRTVAYPSADASIQGVATVAALLAQLGNRFTYLLAVDGSYVAAAATALSELGRTGDQPPFSIAAGGGDQTEFARIRADRYQKASVAEPLTLEGWQLIDELNRARARTAPSNFIAPPSLITQSNAPDQGTFDPPSGYRQNYLRIWHR